MKKLLPLILTTLAFLFAACGPKEDPIVEVVGVSLSQSTLSIVRGGSTSLTATVTPSNATNKAVTWASSNSSVATVNNGNVNAIAVGTANITATAGGKTASCQVTVTPKGVTSIKLEPESASMNVKDVLNIVATISPNDADDKTITWSSSDERVATVDNGKVTAVGKGKATITAAAGSVKVNCEVAVSYPIKSISLNNSTIELEEESEETLIAKVDSEDPDVIVGWSSESPDVATVDENGVVKGISAGETTITAKVGDKSATCKVTVTKKPTHVTSIEFIETDRNVYIGKTIQLSVKKTPSDAIETPTLTSSDESIATVDQDGKVTAVGLGHVTITATVGEIKATYDIEVLNPTIESVTVEPAQITVNQGDTVRFTVKVEPEETVLKDINWNHNNSSVLRVTFDENFNVINDGSFVAVGQGTATVSVIINAYARGTAEVTVIEPDFMAKEKAALMAFYNANKDHWQYHENWGSDGPVTSAWEGVEMDATNTHVKALNIRGACGKIPKEIGDLTELEGFDIRGDQTQSYGLPKSTFGPLPKEIGNLKKLNRIVFYDYPLTGKFPEELFNLTNLETLYIVRSIYMDSAPLSSSIGKLTNLRALDLNTNNITGPLPDQIGNLTKLTWLNLSYNSFTGTIPASYSGMRNLEHFNLRGNKLSGTIPASLARIERFPLIWGPAVESNNFSQEDIRKSKIPSPPSPPIKTLSGKELDLEAFIKSNQYTVLFDVAADYSEVTEYLTSLENLYKKGKSKGLGVLTYFDNNAQLDHPNLAKRDQMFKDELKQSGAEWESFIRHMYDKTPTEESPFYSEHGESIYPHGSINQMVIIGPEGTVDYTTLVDNDQKKKIENALKYLEKVLNVSMTHYESKSYSRDKKHTQLQKASTGKGIDLVITGDAFSDRDISSGTFEKAAKQAMNDFFSVEPMKSMKNRFNVHMVEAVSKNDEYFSGCSTAFSGAFGGWSAVGGNNSKVLEYAKVAVGESKMDNVIVLVLMNSYRDGGTCYMLDPANTSTYAGGASIAWVTYKDVSVSGGLSNLANTVVHEVAGHGLGKLADEYGYIYQGEVTSGEIAYINKVQKWNWFQNISVTPTKSQVPWSQFIGDSDFASEKIGVYEGGDTFWSGVWRPTEQSVMNDSYAYSAFNAPSRSQIYTRIMKLSEGESWKYDYNAFKTWDKAHPTTRATRSIVEVDGDEHVHVPPVRVGKTWKEVLEGRK